MSPTVTAATILSFAALVLVVQSQYIKVVLDSREDVLYVNKKAIKTAGGKQFVYVLNESGLRESKDVTVGAEFGDVIEILSGLKEGDSVLLD